MSSLLIPFTFFNRIFYFYFVFLYIIYFLFYIFKFIFVIFNIYFFMVEGWIGGRVGVKEGERKERELFEKRGRLREGRKDKKGGVGGEME